jgi:pyruvate formate lyase activating enzyme
VFSLIPTLNDSKENILRLKSIVSNKLCVDKIELLPFKKLCQTKYDNLNLEFKFGDLPTPTKADMEKLQVFL